MSKTIRIKVPTIEEVEFRLSVEQETSEVRRNALASGDDAEDKKYEDYILERLSKGDVWAWACITVTAKWRGLTGTDMLGCCCYIDEKDFTQPEGYYDDMKHKAYNNLISQIEKLRK